MHSQQPYACSAWNVLKTLSTLAKSCQKLCRQIKRLHQQTVQYHFNHGCDDADDAINHILIEPRHYTALNTWTLQVKVVWAVYLKSNNAFRANFITIIRGLHETIAAEQRTERELNSNRNESNKVPTFVLTKIDHQTQRMFVICKFCSMNTTHQY